MDFYCIEIISFYFFTYTENIWGFHRGFEHLLVANCPLCPCGRLKFGRNVRKIRPIGNFSHRLGKDFRLKRYRRIVVGYVYVIETQVEVCFGSCHSGALQSDFLWPNLRKIQILAFRRVWWVQISPIGGGNQFQLLS